MRSSQRNALLAVHCGWIVMVLAGCGPWLPKSTDDRAPHPEVAPAQPACTQWDAYDADWHRRHCNDPIHWCSVPGAFDTTNGGKAGTTGSAGSEGSTTGAAGVKGSTGSAGSEGSAAGGAGSTGVGGSAGTGAGGEKAATDAGLSESDAGASGDSGAALDGGQASTDANHATGGQGACVAGTTCPQGTSCVAGSCQTCAGGVCTCQRDNDCSANLICDHDTATCTAPPAPCTALPTEAACAARVDCTPFYGGMSCTNTAGSPCHSGEANCTCATYSYAACVERD
jgi:hypothetical protein